jgi:hypothetical protein
MATYTDQPPWQRSYTVYRCWTADGRCLYVGKAGGKRGPVPVTERLRRHAREQPWWKNVARIDFGVLDGYPAVMAEERTQILALRPTHNVNLVRCRKAGHEMDGTGRCKTCAHDYQVPYQREWRKGPGRVAYEADYREEHREELRDYQRDYMRERRSDPAFREEENRRQRECRRS